MKKFIISTALAAFTLVSCSCDNKPASYATPAEGARATAQAQYDALAKGDLNALYTSLPASFQKDISSVVKAAAGKADADIYKGVSGLLVSFADVGISNSKLFAEMLSDEDNKFTAAEVKNAATALKGFVNKLTLDTLKKGDVAGILASKEVTELFNLVQKAMPLSVIKFSGAEENEDGSVTLIYKDKDGDEDECDFVNVDGVWVLDDIADDWKSNIEELLETVAEFEIDAESKAQFMSVLPTLQEGVAALKKAKTKEELQMGLMTMYMPLMMMQMGGGGGFDFDDDADEE